MGMIGCTESLVLSSPMSHGMPVRITPEGVGAKAGTTALLLLCETREKHLPSGPQKNFLSLSLCVCLSLSSLRIFVPVVYPQLRTTDLDGEGEGVRGISYSGKA